MSQHDDDHQMIEDCERREEKLTEWEQGFIDSLSSQIARRPLTDKQRSTLERIWERVT